MALHPYLFFNGNCRDAFTQYQAIFGGDLTLIRSADMPADEQMPGADGEAIMHAALSFGDNLLMASDDPTSDGSRTVQGIMVNYSVADPDEAKRAFGALAEGGEVSLPIAATSWSPMFGMCVDRFGTPWMVSVDAPTQG
jgi:PhnB protein